MDDKDHYWGFNEHLGFSNCCCTTGCENKVKISVILGKGYTIHRVTFWFLNPNKGDGGWWLPISTPESLALSLAMNLREKNFPRAEVGQLLYIFEIMEIMGILLRADVWETRFRLFFFENATAFDHSNMIHFAEDLCKSNLVRQGFISLKYLPNILFSQYVFKVNIGMELNIFWKHQFPSTINKYKEMREYSHLS